MIFGKCKLHTTRSGVNANFKQILSLKTLNTLDGATYDQRNCCRQTTWKKSYVKLLQIVHLL